MSRIGWDGVVGGGLLLLMIRWPPISTLMAYTRLFRSSGAEWSGVEWSGVEWSGAERSGVEWSGGEGSRSEGHTSELQSHEESGWRLLREK